MWFTRFFLPQSAVSSELSRQSFSPSQTQCLGIHLESIQRNFSSLQVVIVGTGRETTIKQNGITDCASINKNNVVKSIEGSCCSKLVVASCGSALKKQSRNSQETVKKQTRNSQETVKKQTRNSQETVKKQTRKSKVVVVIGPAINWAYR